MIPLLEVTTKLFLWVINDERCFLCSITLTLWTVTTVVPLRWLDTRQHCSWIPFNSYRKGFALHLTETVSGGKKEKIQPVQLQSAVAMKEELDAVAHRCSTITGKRKMSSSRTCLLSRQRLKNISDFFLGCFLNRDLLFSRFLCCISFLLSFFHLFSVLNWVFRWFSFWSILHRQKIYLKSFCSSFGTKVVIGQQKCRLFFHFIPILFMLSFGFSERTFFIISFQERARGMLDLPLHVAQTRNFSKQNARTQRTISFPFPFRFHVHNTSTKLWRENALHNAAHFFSLGKRDTGKVFDFFTGKIWHIHS